MGCRGPGEVAGIAVDDGWVFGRTSLAGSLGTSTAETGSSASRSQWVMGGASSSITGTLRTPLKLPPETPRQESSRERSGRGSIAGGRGGSASPSRTHPTALAARTPGGSPRRSRGAELLTPGTAAPRPSRLGAQNTTNPYLVPLRRFRAVQRRRTGSTTVSREPGPRRAGSARPPRPAGGSRTAPPGRQPCHRAACHRLACLPGRPRPPPDAP